MSAADHAIEIPLCSDGINVLAWGDEGALVGFLGCPYQITARIERIESEAAAPLERKVQILLQSDEHHYVALRLGEFAAKSLRDPMVRFFENFPDYERWRARNCPSDPRDDAPALMALKAWEEAA